MVYAKFGGQTECIMGNWKIENWWDELREAGPPLGYYPNSKKCWLVVKPKKEGRAKEMFAGTGINITTEGRKHLGAALGSRSYLEQYLGGPTGSTISSKKIKRFSTEREKNAIETKGKCVTTTNKNIDVINNKIIWIIII